MMNKLKYLGLFIILVLSVVSVNAQEDSQANAAITLERTACLGVCPVYTVTILEDGTVLYNGERFVDVEGEQTAEIDPETVALIVGAFERAGYFDWDEAYDTQSVSDLPTVITSVTREGETHRISHYLGDSSAPLALSFLEHWVDEMAGIQGYTGVQTDLTGISNGTDTPIITMQQTACFGLCPVYSVALYADGTTVYMGNANVSEIGVYVVENEPAVIESIAQRAQLSGYFTWQDRYDTIVITDQATITTSVRWEDQWKQIVRYAGDSSAPVGILWVEENIEQLVADLVG
ncbi:MAG: DUF6438 domain-containing protein [Anaerolineae bacterium]|nr:DUF6438 domain-containing protein [Anaerolineae bacterium]